MQFTLCKREPITDKAIIEDIKMVQGKLGKTTLTIKEYDKFGTISSSTALRRFGSWNRALSLAGVDVSNQFYEHTDFMDNIKSAWLKKGKQPTRRDMDNKELSSISSGCYLRRYETWYKALECFVEYMSSVEEDTYIHYDNIPQNTIKHTTKREPSDRLKVQVLMRDGNRCRICGVECSDGLHNIHFDHIIPWSKGGETTLENLQVLCSDCNEAKGDLL